MISTWIWSKLPGAPWAKVAILAVAIVAITAVLFEVVFPWVSTLLPFQEQTVE